MSTESPNPAPHLDEEEAAAARMVQGRPVPSPGFRGALERYLAAHDPGHGPRPAHVRVIGAAYVLGGLALIALGALSAAGQL